MTSSYISQPWLAQKRRVHLLFVLKPEGYKKKKKKGKIDFYFVSQSFFRTLPFSQGLIIYENDLLWGEFNCTCLRLYEINFWEGRWWRTSALLHGVPSGSLMMIGEISSFLSLTVFLQQTSTQTLSVDPWRIQVYDSAKTIHSAALLKCYNESAELCIARIFSIALCILGFVLLTWALK